MALLTAEQRQWVGLQKLVKRQRPSKRPKIRPRGTFQSWCFDRATHKHGWWSRIMTVFYIAHICVLMSVIVLKLRISSNHLAGPRLSATLRVLCSATASEVWSSSGVRMALTIAPQIWSSWVLPLSSSLICSLNSSVWVGRASGPMAGTCSTQLSCLVQYLLRRYSSSASVGFCLVKHRNSFSFALPSNSCKSWIVSIGCSKLQCKF